MSTDRLIGSSAALAADRVGAWMHPTTASPRRTSTPSRSGRRSRSGSASATWGRSRPPCRTCSGFHPHESVVLLGLGGVSGRRVGLTVPADIPPPEHNRSLATLLARSLRTDDPDGALVLVVSEAADGEFAGDRGLPHHDLVWEMCRALSRLGVGIG